MIAHPMTNSAVYQISGLLLSLCVPHCPLSNRVKTECTIERKRFMLYFNPFSIYIYQTSLFSHTGFDPCSAAVSIIINMIL